MTRTKRGIDFQVAVVGAGAAGVCAAAAAGRSGLSVLLVDGATRLGGSVTAAMHRCMCGLYSSQPESITDTLNGGLQREIVSRLAAAGAILRQLGKAWVLEFPADAWERSLNEICAESNVDLHLACPITSVRLQDNRIAAIELDQTEWIEPKVVIDCTGGGAILKLIGPRAFQPPDENTGRILAGYAARLAPIHGDPELLRLQIPYFLARAVLEEKLPSLARFTVFYPGPKPGEGICKLAVDPARFDDSQAESFLNQVIEHLKQNITALADAQIVEKSPRILPRDGLRLNGKYVLTEQDVLESRQIGDEAVHAWWPMEKWETGQGPTYAYPPEGRHYDIPVEALQSSEFENLLAAGACLSATSNAAASSRASGICLATGEAAGKLARSPLDRRDLLPPPVLRGSVGEGDEFAGGPT